MVNHTIATSVLVAIAIVVSGCGPSGPPMIKVQGTIQYQGKPLTNGAIIFSPLKSSTGHVANSAIDGSGRFSMSTFKMEDGVLPGDYAITVRSFQVPANATSQDPTSLIGAPLCVPKRYSDPAKSDLRCTLTADSAEQDLTLNLTE